MLTVYIDQEDKFKEVTTWWQDITGMQADSDVARLKDNALKINPQLCFFEISATRGMGMDEWCEYLLACFERKEEK